MQKDESSILLMTLPYTFLCLRFPFTGRPFLSITQVRNRVLWLTLPLYFLCLRFPATGSPFLSITQVRNRVLWLCLSENVESKERPTILIERSSNIPIITITTRRVIFITDIPDAPQNLEIHDVASRSVRLTWQKPFDGNFPITRYTIMWRQTDGKTVGGPLHVPGSETTLIIRGLRPKTRYFFRVKCENTLGESQFGAEVAITTLEERRYRDFCMFLRSRNLRGHLSLSLTE
ncbi:down syndrome cell adhesion molecule-like protein Dscam2 [Caerostris extrusa]|uniref:Down syndrome cell adhesion molecule-like protein Dscam2 n=1 Tax=Caerostris extrusa TaxID=172846 RepID=A0AAV4X8M2_CAEEX|nr:down syndrome cell adhesion molecule-like protein Dscam2 [Caerostris extrusa]